MNLEPLLNASLAIQIHVIAAVIAFVLGGLVLFRRKGDRLHRIGGRIWVGVMLVVAISSFFIHSIRLWGPWSPIHILSILSLYSLYRGVEMARRKNIVSHQRFMKSTYLGALVIAGLFTFMPGRMMHEVFFEGPRPIEGIALALAIVCASAGAALYQSRRTRTGLTRSIAPGRRPGV